MNDPNAPLPYLEVAAYLEAEGVAGSATGWPVFRGFMPASPDAVVALFPAGGTPGEGKYDLRYPQVQVRVRGAPHEQTPPYAKLEEIRQALRGVLNQTIGAGRYAHLIPASDVLALGQDANQRHEYTLTFRAAREPAA